MPMFIECPKLPTLSAEESITVARVILADEAERPTLTPRHGRPKEPLQGEFVLYFGTAEWRRGTDVSERIYASVEILMRAGQSYKEACIEVATILGHRLGVSGRGRKPTSAMPRDFSRLANNIRVRHREFRKRHPWKESLPCRDQIVEKWVIHAMWVVQGLQALSQNAEWVHGPASGEAKLQIARKLASFTRIDSLSSLFESK
jgi:hypothetical protein